MLSYPISLTPDDNGTLLVTFPDVPEAITVGEDEEDAKVQALDALEADHAFLLRGDVFTKDVIETWLGYKRDKEIDAIRLRPHPYEFHLYYDI